MGRVEAQHDLDERAPRRREGEDRVHDHEDPTEPRDALGRGAFSHDGSILEPGGRLGGGDQAVWTVQMTSIRHTMTATDRAATPR